MTETNLRIRLGELATVRIQCRKGNCQGVIEVSMEQLRNIRRGTECPVCREVLLPRAMSGDGDQPFLEFQRAIRRLLDLQNEVLVEFSIPADKPQGES